MQLPVQVYLLRRRASTLWLVGALLATVIFAGAIFAQAAAAPNSPKAPETQEEKVRKWETALAMIQTEVKAGSRDRHLAIVSRRIRKVLCEEGQFRHCPEYADLNAKNVDLEKLAYAVAVAETGNCTTGIAPRLNNCHGIKGRNGKFREFRSTEESFLAFQSLWLRVYGDRFPTVKEAARYSGGEGYAWLERVRIAYHSKKAAELAAL